MQALFESPWPAIWFGVLAEALLGVAFFNTRRVALIWAMAGVLVVTGLLLVTEWAVVTDVESVEYTLEAVARALESNDIEQVLAHVAPEAGPLRAAIRTYVPSIEISDANVGGDLKVTVNHFTQPATARAEFTGRISGKARNPSRGIPYDNFFQRFAIKFRQEGDHWLLADYELLEMRGGSEP